MKNYGNLCDRLFKIVSVNYWIILGSRSGYCVWGIGV